MMISNWKFDLLVNTTIFQRFNLALTLQPSYLIIIFTLLKLCLADAVHNFKRVKIIQIFDEMDVKHFDIFLIGVTFYLQRVQKLVFYVLIKKNLKQI